MNAMILAAGLGTRLRNVVRNFPKVLIDIGGRPLLGRHLEYLDTLGMERVVINVHHLAAEVESFVRRYRGRMEVLCVREDRLLGTAGGVRNALHLLDPSPFVVLYGDVLVGQGIAPMLEIHHRSGASATLAVHEASSAEGKGVVEVGDAGRVKRFVEKGGSTSAKPLINSGIYVLESDLVSTIPSGTFSDFGTDVFPAALANGVPIFAYRLAAPVIDIGTPEGLVLARSSVARRPC